LTIAIISVCFKGKNVKLLVGLGLVARDKTASYE
jgi:hypothetical protein